MPRFDSDASIALETIRGVEGICDATRKKYIGSTRFTRRNFVFSFCGGLQSNFRGLIALLTVLMSGVVGAGEGASPLEHSCGAQNRGEAPSLSVATLPHLSPRSGER
jgi:hypothetical protein